MTTGKTIALIRWTFVGKVMSLFFTMLSRLVITFLPRSKHLLISWLQSTSAVILEPPKIKSDTVSTVSPSSHEVMGPDAMIFVFWAMVFPVVMYGCESWTVKKAEHRRIDAFELWCWRRLLRVPWRSNQSFLKEINPGISLEGMMLKLKLHYFGHLM